MTNLPAKTVSAVISSEKRLEFIINKLTENVVGRHEISIQGSPTEIAEKYGTPYLDPEIIQQSKNPPKTDSFLRDDFGWVLGLSFAIPLFICVVIAIFIIGDIRSTSDNILYGVLGVLVGAIIGTLFATYVKKHQENHLRSQEKKGGFVLWITVTPDTSETTDEKINKIIAILKKYRALHIKIN